MQRWIFVVALLGLPAAAQEPCPPGQTRSTDGGCVAEMPATPHQEEVLEPGAGPQQPGATGAATGRTTGSPQGSTEMPATPHQEKVLKPETGG